MSNEEMSSTYCVKRCAGGGCKHSEPLRMEAWKGAEMLEDFAFPWIETQAPRTRFRALWDGEFFCFRYEVEDADVVMAEGKDAMEKVVGSDRVEIFFTTGPELDPYYGLEIDPRGEVLAYEGRYHRIMNWDWQCPGLQVWAEVTEKGYNVEAAIPMETLRALNCLHEGSNGNYLQAGLFRAEFSHGKEGEPVIEDWISWVDPGGETPDFHVPTAFGVLKLDE